VVCSEEADTPEHVLLHCRCLDRTRLLDYGNIHMDPELLRDGDVVASLAAEYCSHREPLGYSLP